MNPIGNIQGGYNCMSLIKVKKIDRQQWDVIPIPDSVIKAVEKMAEQEEQPLIQNGELIFEWAPDIPINSEQVYDEENKIVYEEEQTSVIEGDTIVNNSDDAMEENVEDNIEEEF